MNLNEQRLGLIARLVSAKLREMDDDVPPSTIREYEEMISEDNDAPEVLLENLVAAAAEIFRCATVLLQGKLSEESVVALIERIERDSARGAVL